MNISEQTEKLKEIRESINRKKNDLSNLRDEIRDLYEDAEMLFESCSEGLEFLESAKCDIGSCLDSLSELV